MQEREFSPMTWLVIVVVLGLVVVALDQASPHHGGHVMAVLHQSN
jgi:uncharacterized membrane protein